MIPRCIPLALAVVAIALAALLGVAIASPKEGSGPRGWRHRAATMTGGVTVPKNVSRTRKAGKTFGSVDELRSELQGECSARLRTRTHGKWTAELEYEVKAALKVSEASWRDLVADGDAARDLLKSLRSAVKRARKPGGDPAFRHIVREQGVPLLGALDGVFDPSVFARRDRRARLVMLFDHPVDEHGFEGFLDCGREASALDLALLSILTAPDEDPVPLAPGQGAQKAINDERSRMRKARKLYGLPSLEPPAVYDAGPARSKADFERYVRNFTQDLRRAQYLERLHRWG